MTRTSSRLRPDQRREQILAAARRVLEADPHREPTVELVAAEAGVSPALLFHYFGSKRSFQYAVLEAAAAELMLRTAPDPSLPPAEQLLAGIAAFVDAVVEQPELYRATLLRSAAGDETVRRLHTQLRDTFDGWVIAAVGALGVKVTPAVRLACQGWQGYVEQTLLRWLDEDDPAVARKELHRLCQHSLGAVLGTAVRTAKDRERLASIG
jgi:AcrR family transcriptional regulator